MEADNLTQGPGAGPNGLIDESETFEKMKALLMAKNDTSRFVGLALLKTVLDNHEQLAQDPERIRILWEAMSPKFFDRLLRAFTNEKVTEHEAKDMVELAVAVLHTFTSILPEESRKEKRLCGRVAPLVKAIIRSTQETRVLILQTLLTIVSRSEGALELLAVEDLSPLTDIAVEYPYVLDILRFTWTLTTTSHIYKVNASIDATMPALIKAFEMTDAVTFVSFSSDVVSISDIDDGREFPPWTTDLIRIFRKLVCSKPTQAGRAAYTHLAANLLQLYPSHACRKLIFGDDSVTDVEKKPFLYLFIKLLLIDLRASFPNLLAQLNSGEYVEISKRLVSVFAILASFIAYLAESWDDDKFSIPPDLLMNLRKDIAETMSLAIEYLRDRWDGSKAGASGLHPSARAGTVTTSEGSRLALTWESAKDVVNADPLILAALRPLSIWLREDENENLRNEAAGLMDMLLDLYQNSSEETQDFKDPILLALQGIMATEVGVSSFLEHEGWRIVSKDLEDLLKTATQSNKSTSVGQRGLVIINVLLAVLDDPSNDATKEEWMGVVKVTASIQPPAKDCVPLVLEFHIGMLQLSAALLSKAHSGMQKRYITVNPALSGLTQQLLRLVKGIGDKKEAKILTELLNDVELELEDLRS